MSKMDDLRKMREARYEQAAARARTAGQTGTPARRTPAPIRPPAPAPAPVSDEASEPSDELCGHRNMGGRTCTRERGHSAKSHRYS